MTRQHPEAPAIAALCFLACAAMIGFLALAQLFGQFRHVGPSAMQWVNAHGDAVREVLLRWVA